MRDFKRQIQAYSLIESLLNNGHTITTLPIDRERAAGILECRVQATEGDLRILRQAGASATTPQIQK